MSQWFFHYQLESKESVWSMALASERQNILETKNPAFVTVLDVSNLPETNEWEKTRYLGPLYFDFDADGDIERVCDNFSVFMGKVADEWEIDLEQCQMWASGGKGFHMEIPMECFMSKIPAGGVPWLPYVYREMAQKVIVDTLDLSVYSGKKGRMWRTPGVKRENGNYKVPLTVEEAMAMTPELYAEVIKVPRPPIPATPAVVSSPLALVFDQAKTKVQELGRSRKRKAEAAGKLLAPWKKSNVHMPTMQAVMSGEKLAQGVGFNRIAMQVAIYGTAMGLTLADFLALCAGLVNNHSGDGWRYGTKERRRAELQRMYEYMDTASLYEFDPGPIVSMLEPGTMCPDLGVIEETDATETPNDGVKRVGDDGKPLTADEIADAMTQSQLATIRRGLFMNADGIFRRTGDKVEAVCRGVLKDIMPMHTIPEGEEEEVTFLGYSFDLNLPRGFTRKAGLPLDTLTSLQAIKRFFMSHSLSFQGVEPDVNGLFDIMNERSQQNTPVFVCPREGLGFHRNPVNRKRTDPIIIYLTKNGAYKSLFYQGDTDFQFRYQADMAVSHYDVDIHRAPRLADDHADVLEHLFMYNKPSVVADSLGWFIACHFRAIYQLYFNQFPLMQVYGEAGSGKTQTVMMLARMHWYFSKIPVTSAMGLTPFALETAASTSSSAPLILDEYKPRELMKAGNNKLPKLRDVLKAAYVGGQIANKGILTSGARGGVGTVRMDAVAPIVFMTEAIEMETAILERSVAVNFSKINHTQQREDSFHELENHPEVISAVGREVLEYALRMNPEDFREDFLEERKALEAAMPKHSDRDQKRDAPRVIFNRAIVNHALRVLRTILKARYGLRFEDKFDMLLNAEASRTEERNALRVSSMSEVGKVMSRLALMSFDEGDVHEVRMGKDYQVIKGNVEVKVETCYDRYRLFCVKMHETPLFDSLESFRTALATYGPMVNPRVTKTDLRDQGSTATVMAFSLTELTREGVQSFRI